MRWLRRRPGDRRSPRSHPFDIAGFSRLVQDDETVRRSAIDSVLEDPDRAEPVPVQRHAVQDARRRRPDRVSASVVDAVDWAVDVQGAWCATAALGRPGAHLSFRVGIAIGDIIVSNNDRFGEGDRARGPGSGTRRAGTASCCPIMRTSLVRGKTPDPLYGWRDCGALKNFPEPMQIWHWVPAASRANADVPEASQG